MTPLDMDFGILGPVEARSVSGVVLPVPHGRPLALLALLLVRRGEVVSADAAIESLWGHDQPAHPGNALQLVISRIRRALGEHAHDGAEVLVHQGAGYAIRLAPGMLDADRFETLTTAGRAQLARGDAAGAATALRRALGLWRGPALADVRDEPFARVEVGRLEELRLAALGDRIEADLALGRHVELVGEVAALVDAHPLREPLHGQLMLALHGSGRQAEALAAYREARRLLVDELGIEPSRGLREIERLILQGELDPRPAEPGLAGGRRRQITCLAVEPTGVDDRNSPLDPEALQQLLLDLHERVRGVCNRLDGTVLESSTGEIAAVFGWPNAHEDDALRAVLAAAELRGATRGSTLRFGLATGEFVTPERGAPLVLGDAGARAHRLAGCADPGQILLGSSTWTLVRGSADGSIAPGAAGHDAQTFALGSVHADAVASRRPTGPLFGREAELDLLLEAHDRATTSRTCQLVTVLGEPGVGKSRLSLALARRLGSSTMVLRGACPLYDQALTYWPLREIVQRAAGVEDVTEWAVDLGLDRRIAERVVAALGMTDGLAGDETPWAFRRLVVTLAQRGPVALVIDDIHAARAELLDLIEHLASLRDAPVLLVCLARPELLEDHPTWASGALSATSIHLRPLSEGDSRALVLRLAETAGHATQQDLDTTIVDRVVDTAGGNPLFLEQLFRHLLERPDAADAIPPELQALLATRLDLIPVEERNTLERGAVEGETFHLESVVAMAGQPAATTPTRRQVERSLESLIRRDLIAPVAATLPGAGSGFAFRHRLVREAAYAALTRAERAALHERYADWLGRFDPPCVDSATRLGFHLEQAHDHVLAVGGDRGRAAALAMRAGRHLAEAARQAHRHSDLAAEIGLLERAVRLFGTDRDLGAELLPALAAANIEAGTFARAAEVAALGMQVGEDLDLPSVYWSSTVERERMRLYSQPAEVDVEESLLITEQAAAQLSVLGNDLGLARVDYLAAEIMWMCGEPDTAVSYLQRQVTHARSAGAGFELAAALTYLAWSLAEGVTPVPQALDSIAVLETESAGDYVAGLGLLGFRSVLEAMAGRPDDAREHMALARTGYEELGLRLPAAAMAGFDARSRMLVGDFRTAEQAVLYALHISRDSGDRWFQSTLLVDHAHTVLGGRRLPEAEAAVARIETVPAPSDTEWVVRRATALALLASLRGDDETGLTRANEAVARADPSQMLTLRVHAHRVLVEVLVRGGRAREAAGAAVDARRLARQKGDTVTDTIVDRLVNASERQNAT